MHNPPPFIPADLRISPSGPYVSGGAEAIIRAGYDCAVDSPPDVTPIVLDETPLAPSFVWRQQTAGDPPVNTPIQVTFPFWNSDDVLWVIWHFSGVGVLSEDETAVVLTVEPVVDVGDGSGFQSIQPSGVGGTYPSFAVGAEDFGAGPFNLAGTAAIKITDPVAPPIVRLAYSFVGVDDPGNNTVIYFGVLPNGIGPFSAWLAALELDPNRVFQLPPEVTLTPAA